MGTLFVLFLVIFVSVNHGSPMGGSYDTIIVGMGPAGAAAAATLAAAGRSVLALEAQNRVGGRVYTAPFGDGTVELGAEWIHGTKGSRVYELAIRNNVTVLPQELDFKVYQSDGSSEREAVVNELVNFALEAVDDPPRDPQPLGQYLTKRINQYIIEKHPEIKNDTEFIAEFLAFMDLVIDNYEATSSWNDITTESRYTELEGHQHMSWHTHGYKTLFEILLNKFNGGPGYPNLEVKLNTEVTRISWPQDPNGDVAVTCADGGTHSARNVIVTVSLGVLKERHASLFSPPLPTQHINVIETLSIGVMDKVQLLFNEVWWPGDGSFFGFVWKTEHKQQVAEDDWWTTKIFGASCPLANRNVLTVWTSGEGAKLVETLPEDVVRRKVMEVLRRFMGAGRTVPEPVDMLRSTWYSNPFTRGSYTFDNLLTPRHPTARADLGTPLCDAAGAPRVLFAGEATNPTHFSTVHGAVDTGVREAMRLLPSSNI